MASSFKVSDVQFNQKKMEPEETPITFRKNKYGGHLRISQTQLFENFTTSANSFLINLGS